MWITTTLWTLAYTAAVPVLVFNWAQWYTRRCVERSKNKVNERLEHFQAIANTYTKEGTPEELQRIITELHGLLRELEFLERN